VAARYAYVTLIIVASIHEDPHSLARRPIFITIACSLRFFVAQGAERGRGEALSPRQRLLAELFLLFLYRYLERTFFNARARARISLFLSLSLIIAIIFRWKVLLTSHRKSFRIRGSVSSLSPFSLSGQL